MAKKLIKRNLEKFLSKMSTKETKQEIEEQEVKNEAQTEENIENTEDSSTNETSAIEKLEAEKKELNDKFLRLFSDFDNFRKRSAKEKLEITKTASAGVIKDLLSVVDDFDRAIENNEKSEDIDAIKEGFSLIHNKFYNILKNKGLAEVEAKGETFDVDKHEAITQIPAPTEDQKGKVVDVIEKGYALNETIIRFPKVIVGQ
ncbi:MAG: nucleotide exchange factor GrpE [Flavobacteriales bacterium]|jgi:molecular chaperone GrpE|nr:nucleotide exchange factor GrpE [Flavobacteriales bacterium]